MRISDWSSDVCSSDLRVAGNHLAGGKLAPQKRNRMLPQGQADMAIILDDLPPLLHRLEPHGLLDDFMDKSVLAGVRRREQGKLLVVQRLDRPERIAARKEHRHTESVGLGPPVERDHADVGATPSLLHTGDWLVSARDDDPRGILFVEAA